MAATSRPPEISIEESLTHKACEFSFFQAMRLLRMLVENDAAGQSPGKVRVRPELSLSFPPADVASIEKRVDGYRLNVTFLGLYGQSSPLPTFYTEQLLDESASDQSAARDFLDIVNHELITIYYECTKRCWLNFQVAQQGQEEYLDMLFCLMGLGGDKFRNQFPEPLTLLRYAELFTLRSRSALGLETLLQDALQVPVRVIQCQERRVPIPPDQQMQLGDSNTTLGVDAVLGSEVIDDSGMFRVNLGPLDWQVYGGYLPGTPGRQRLDSLVRIYLAEPLAWDLELRLAAEEAPGIVIGSEMGTRLGWDAWLGPGGEEASMIFQFVQAPQAAGGARS